MVECSSVVKVNGLRISKGKNEAAKTEIDKDKKSVCYCWTAVFWFTKWKEGRICLEWTNKVKWSAGFWRFLNEHFVGRMDKMCKLDTKTQN